VWLNLRWRPTSAGLVVIARAGADALAFKPVATEEARLWAAILDGGGPAVAAAATPVLDTVGFSSVEGDVGRSIRTSSRSDPASPADASITASSSSLSFSSSTLKPARRGRDPRSNKRRCQRGHGVTRIVRQE